MRTSDITGQFPVAAKEFDLWLFKEINISEKLFDKLYYLTRIATLNGFLGYSMDTEPYMDKDQGEAFQEIIERFRLYEQAIPYRISDDQFVRWINDIKYHDMEKHFPGLNDKLTRDCIADCARMVKQRSFFSDCIRTVRKQKRIMNCVVPLAVSEDEYLRKFWEESIKFSWLIKQGAEVCPF